MRNAIFLFSALFFFFQSQKSFAQETLESESKWVPLLAFWNKGDVFNYEVNRGKIRYKNGEQTDSTGQKNLQILTVTDSTSEGYTIRVSGECSFEWETLGISETDLADLFSKYGHIELEYDISLDGEFKDFRNLDLMTQAFKEMLQLMLQEKEMLHKMDGLVQMITTEEYMRRKVFMAYPLLHQFFGYQFPVDSTLVFEEEFPNFTNPAQPLILQVKVQTLQEAEWEGLVVLKKRYEFDSDMCKQLYEGVLQKVPEGQKLINAGKDMAMTVECHANYVFDPDSGTIHALYYTHEIFVDGELLGKEFLEMDLVGWNK